MNKKTAILLSVAGIAVIVFVVLFFKSREEKTDDGIIPATWIPDYKYNSRDPYGGYLFFELLKQSNASFKEVKGNPATFINDNLGFLENRLLVIYANSYPDYFYLWERLYEFVENGNKILFILETDPASLKDAYENIFDISSVSGENTILHFTGDKKRKYRFERLDEFEPAIQEWNYFYAHDNITIGRYYSKKGARRALNVDDPPYFFIHEVNESGKIVFLEIPYGRGSIFIHRTPVAFSNIALLQEKNVEHLERVLSKIDHNGVIYNTHVPLKPTRVPGKLRASPLQFILKDTSLSWAYYVLIGSLLLFVLFNLKRKQKPIPVMQPKDNSTLEYADALSKVYFRQHNNKNMVMHKQRYFNTFIRTRYHINLIQDQTEAARMISAKSGVGESEIESLLKLMGSYLKFTIVTDEQLMKLHTKLDNFYKNCK